MEVRRIKFTGLPEWFLLTATRADIITLHLAVDSLIIDSDKADAKGIVGPETRKRLEQMRVMLNTAQRELPDA